MSLYIFTISTACLLVFIGFAFVSKPKRTQILISGLLRSQKAAICLLVMSLIWFLYEHVQNLGEADFGDYKFIIGLIGVCVAVSSYFFINDFLSVRAFCILLLFYSREALDSAFLQEPQTRLFLVSIIYLIIIVSLYFGAWPYRMRDFLKWLYNNSKRPPFLGFSFMVYGFVLFGISFTY